MLAASGQRRSQNVGSTWQVAHRHKPLDSPRPRPPAILAGSAHTRVANPCRQPWTHGLKRLCRNSRPRSYSLDRMITPYEAFRI